jgi:hypothetical protein
MLDRVSRGRRRAAVLIVFVLIAVGVFVSTVSAQPQAGQVRATHVRSASPAALAAVAIRAHRSVAVKPSGKMLGGFTKRGWPVLVQLSPNGKKLANVGTGFDMTCAPSGNTFSTSDGWSGLKIGPHGAVRVSFTYTPNQSLLGGTDTLTGHYDSKHQTFTGTWELHLNYNLNGALDQCDSDPVTFKVVQ